MGAVGRQHDDQSRSQLAPLAPRACGMGRFHTQHFSTHKNLNLLSTLIPKPKPLEADAVQSMRKNSSIGWGSSSGELEAFSLEDVDKGVELGIISSAVWEREEPAEEHGQAICIRDLA